MAFNLGANPVERTILDKLWHVGWLFLGLISVIAGIGVVALYSAANGSFEPWASRQLARFSMAMALLLIMGLIDLRLYLRLAHVIYVGALGLLVAVELVGDVGMGAQRWLDLGFMQLQPSEMMKVALVLSLARVFHLAAPEDIARPSFLLLPTAMVLAPVALVLMQPDLGTAVILLAVGGVMFFLGGVRIWKFALVIAAGLAAIPIAWQFLHDYQQRRVLTFLNGEDDPLGAGYHIMQAKIALGSGGVSGKGFLQGTQSHLNFLPEKQTDFIFTLFAEEWGLVGALGLIGLYLLVIVYGFAVGLRARSQFGRLIALGLTGNLYFYVFVNIAMVMGMIPVVGVPLPLMSYGGTAMLTVMIGFGLMMSVLVHRDLRLGRRALYDDE